MSLFDDMMEEFSEYEKDAEETKRELIEAKEHNRQLALEIERLNNRCKKLDREAQGYLEEIMGDSSLKERIVNELNTELEQKDKIIDLMADELRYQNGMGQDDLFCYDICKNYEYCDKEICKDRIKDFFTKKAKGEIQNGEK